MYSNVKKGTEEKQNISLYCWCDIIQGFGRLGSHSLTQNGDVNTMFEAKIHKHSTVSSTISYFGSVIALSSYLLISTSILKIIYFICKFVYSKEILLGAQKENVSHQCKVKPESWAVLINEPIKNQWLPVVYTAPAQFESPWSNRYSLHYAEYSAVSVEKPALTVLLFSTETEPSEASPEACEKQVQQKNRGANWEVVWGHCQKRNWLMGFW